MIAPSRQPAIGASPPGRWKSRFGPAVGIFFAACALTLGRPGRAQNTFSLPATRSYSGQFVVLGSSWGGNSRFPSLANNAGWIVLQPTLLAVSCERIKEDLYRQLGAGPAWRGIIYLRLHPAQSLEDPITVVCQRSGGGWVYRVELPDVLEKHRFVSTLVRVLLLEMADRNSGNHTAEIPAWLAEGLSEQLLATSAAEILLPPPGSSENGLAVRRISLDTRMASPLAGARQILQTRPPLSFDQLSWPTTAQLDGEDGGVFRASAQLFVERLCQLNHGCDSLRAMIQELPRHLNWQLAFLEAFHSRFARPLDVEKWWALQLVQFSGRDLMQLLTPEATRRQLDEILRLPAEVRTSPDRLPVRAEVTLQTVIRDWNSLAQMETLQQALRELDLLRLRAAQPMAPLVDDYRMALGHYLKNRSEHGAFRPGRDVRPVLDRVARDTIRQLDALDARRAQAPAGLQTAAR